MYKSIFNNKIWRNLVLIWTPSKHIVSININFLCSAKFNTLRYFVEDKYKGTFEIDTNSGQLYVPEGAGTNLDYEGQNTFTIQITVKDYCQSEDCTFGKLTDKYCGNTCLDWRELVCNANIIPLKTRADCII